MQKTFLIKRRRKKSTNFNPNKEFVNKAVEEYLNEGGKITVIEDIDSEYGDIISNREPSPPADEFLMGH